MYLVWCNNISVLWLSNFLLAKGPRSTITCRWHPCIWWVLLFFKYFHTKHRRQAQHGAKIRALNRRKMTVSNHLASKYVKTIAVKMEVYCNLLNRWEPVTYLWLFDLSYFKWANFKTNIRLLSVSIFYLRRDTDVLSFPLLMSASFVLIVFEFYIHEPNMMSYKCGLFVAWNDRSDRFGDFRC